MTQNKPINNVFYTECVKPCLNDCYLAVSLACRSFSSIPPLGCWLNGRNYCDSFIKGGFGKSVPPSTANDLPPG